MTVNDLMTKEAAWSGPKGAAALGIPMGLVGALAASMSGKRRDRGANALKGGLQGGGLGAILGAIGGSRANPENLRSEIEDSESTLRWIADLEAQDKRTDLEENMLAMRPILEKQIAIAEAKLL